MTPWKGEYHYQFWYHYTINIGFSLVRNKNMTTEDIMKCLLNWKLKEIPEILRRGLLIIVPCTFISYSVASLSRMKDFVDKQTSLEGFLSWKYYIFENRSAGRSEKMWDIWYSVEEVVKWANQTYPALPASPSLLKTNFEVASEQIIFRYWIFYLGKLQNTFLIEEF